MTQMPFRPSPTLATTPARPAPPGPAPVTLSGLLEEVLWIKLLRVPALALRPDRLIPAFLAVVLMAFLASISGIWSSEPTLLARLGEARDDVAGRMAGALGSFDAPGLISALAAAAVDTPVRIASHDPIVTALIAAPVFIVFIVALGALARSAACEFAAGVATTWPQTLGFAVSRWSSYVGAVLVPLVVVGGIALLTAAAGAALLSVPWLNILGALAYPLMVIGAAIAIIIGACMVLGGLMLAPSISCEGTDALDAVQRVFNYVIHRPLVLALYLSIGIALGLVTVGLASALADAAVGFADAMASRWSGLNGEQALTGETAIAGSGNDAAAAIIGVVKAVPPLLVAALGLSYLACMSTVLYLLMREKNDSQHWSEIWFPGVIEGTLAMRSPGAQSEPAPPAADADED